MIKNFSDFYNGNIARKIIKTVNESSNPGFFDISDFQTYEAKKQKAFCYKLVNGLTLCGPNLPSSGTICLIQAFIIYENILKKSQTVSLDETLSILNFIYYLRSKKLADPEFEKINLKKLLDKDELLKNFKLFKKLLL